MSTSSTSSSTTRVRSARTAWSTPMRWFATVTSTRWGSGIVCERALLRERTDVKVDRGHARQDDKDVNKRKKDNSQGERKKIKRRDAGNIAAMIMMRAPLQPSLRSSLPSASAPSSPVLSTLIICFASAEVPRSRSPRPLSVDADADRRIPLCLLHSPALRRRRSWDDSPWIGFLGDLRGGIMSCA